MSFIHTSNQYIHNDFSTIYDSQYIVGTSVYKENSNRDTLTIKLVAYDGDNMITYTGDGEYLNHNDSTWKIKTIVDEEYYDYDECTPLHSVSFSYSIKK